MAYNISIILPGFYQFGSSFVSPCLPVIKVRLQGNSLQFLTSKKTGFNTERRPEHEDLLAYLTSVSASYTAIS